MDMIWVILSFLELIHESNGNEQWKHTAWSNESCFTSHGWLGGCQLPGQYTVLGCTMGRRQAGRGSVMLWAMSCWETMCPAIYVDVDTYYLPMHCCRPRTPFHGNGTPWWVCPLLAGYCTVPQNKKKHVTQGSGVAVGLAGLAHKTYKIQKE